MLIGYLKHCPFVNAANKLGDNETEHSSDSEDNFEVTQKNIIGSEPAYSVRSDQQDNSDTMAKPVRSSDPSEQTTKMEYDPKLIYPSELNIKTKMGEHQFDYFLENKNLGIYKAKDGYGFNKVKQNNIEIWSTTFNSQLASTVLVHGVGSPKKVVTVFTFNREAFVFKKSGKNKPWERIELNVFGKLTVEDEFPFINEEIVDENGINVGRDEKYNKSKIKILVEDPSDPTNSKEVDPSKVKVKKYSYGQYLHEIDDDVNCIEIQIAGLSSWKYKVGDEKLRKFRYLSASNIFILTYETCLVECFKVQSGVYRQVKYPIPPITLFGKDESGNLFQLNDEQYRLGLCRFNNIEYIFSTGIKCVEVRYNNELVWRQEPGLPYATEIRCLQGQRIEIMFGTRGYIYKRSPEVRWFTDYHIVPEVKTGPIVPSYRELM